MIHQHPLLPKHLKQGYTLGAVCHELIETPSVAKCVPPGLHKLDQEDCQDCVPHGLHACPVAALEAAFTPIICCHSMQATSVAAHSLGSPILGHTVAVCSCRGLAAAAAAPASPGAVPGCILHQQTRVLWTTNKTHRCCMAATSAALWMRPVCCSMSTSCCCSSFSLVSSC